MKGAVVSLEDRVFENELMRAAMDAARIGLCVTDAGGRILLLSSGFADRLGSSEQALVGQLDRALLVTGLLLRNATELLDHESPEISIEGRYTDARGRVAILLFQARTIDHADDGKFRVITMIDIADFGVTRNRDLELRRQLDALNSAVVIADVRKDDVPIVYVNRRFEEMTGYAASEVVGRNCRFLQGNDRDQAAVAQLRDAIERRTPCQVVLTNYRKDGSAFRNELYISPVYEESGTATHFIGMQREVGDRVAPDSGI